MSTELTIPIENGFEMGKYKWTQTAKDISVVITLDSDVKVKDISVKYTANTLCIKIKNETFVEGNLLNDVKVDSSTWYIVEVKGKGIRDLVVDLDKQKYEEWWSCVVKGHTQIDTTKVVPENGSIDDLDQETRMTIDKMLYEQRIKEQQGYYNR